MPVNASEGRLTEMVERSFLKPWSYSNPYRTKGKEIADVIVVCGDDVIVFSDKASVYCDDGQITSWSRWYRRTVSDSVKQLSGALRILTQENPTIYLDERASQSFPFELPLLAQRRIHLVAIARAELECLTPWPGLFFDSTASPEKPFRIEPLQVRDRPIHVFDALFMDTFLAELDTISDFVTYLNRREQVITGSVSTQFREFDLLMLHLLERSNGQWGLLLSGSATPSAIPEGLWDDPYCIECRDRSRAEDQKSYIIDRLIDHFHAEYVSGRMLQDQNFPFAAHEEALRTIAKESRFGRRIIANEIVDILNETDQSTFWASTVESAEVAGVRYVWLAYPQPSKGIDDDAFSRSILNHLKDHIYVARSIFKSELLIGVAFPNRAAAETSYFLVVFDGTKWTEDAQRGAEILRTEKGILRDLQPTTRRHVR
jgi:hypothetical protein